MCVCVRARAHAHAHACQRLEVRTYVNKCEKFTIIRQLWIPKLIKTNIQGGVIYITPPSYYCGYFISTYHDESW